MDAEKTQEITTIIKSQRDSGMSSEQIVANLKSNGLSNEDIDLVMYDVRDKVASENKMKLDKFKQMLEQAPKPAPAAPQPGAQPAQKEPFPQEAKSDGEIRMPRFVEAQRPAPPQPKPSEKDEQMKSIITKMNADGVPKAEISANLKTMGVPEHKVESLMQGAATAPTNQEIHDSLSDLHRKLDNGAHLEKVQPMVQKQSELTEQIHSTVGEVGNRVASHDDHLNEIKEATKQSTELLNSVSSKLDGLHNKPPSDDVAVELGEIKKMVFELRSAVNALAEIQKKTLDTNTRFLMRLQK